MRRNYSDHRKLPKWLQELWEIAPTLAKEAEKDYIPDPEMDKFGADIFHEKIQAVRFNGDVESLKTINGLSINDIDIRSSAMRGTLYYLKTRDGKHLLNTGDIVCMNALQEIFVMDVKRFKLKYERLDK